MREMDAGGVPRSEVARRLHVSRNTVAKYADMGDMSPAAPVPDERPRPATDACAEEIDSMLEADLGAPRKQRHTAKRTCDRLVEEFGHEGSYSSVRSRVRAWRLRRAAGDGHPGPGWAPGTAQADFGNFEADVDGERLRPRPLVVCPPRPDARLAVAGMSQRAERVCAGLAGIFGRVGRAPRELVPGDATEAGRRVRGEAAGSHPFPLFRARCRTGSRARDPRSGNERGSIENAVGFIRRNLLVPVPGVGSLAELNALLRAGRDRPSAASRARDGRPTTEALPGDLAAMLSLPSAPFDAVRWVRARADKRGVVTVDGRGYLAGPAWHSRELPVGVRAGTVEVLADRGRRVALPPRAFGDGPAVRNPLSLVPALVARPRAFGEPVTGRDMPEGLVRAIGRASASSGFEAACAAAQAVLEGGRVPDDATVDVLVRRISSGGSGFTGGADLAVCDGFLRGGGAHAC